jgi:hypothetical protein
MSPDPAGQGMFMVRYGTGFVSDDHDGRFPELNPSLFRQASNGLDMPANTGETADADPQRSDGSGGAARMACGGFAGGLRSRCGGFAGAATTEGPRTRAKRLTSIPHVSGVFARVCWPSPNTNQSGRPDSNRGPHRPESRLRCTAFLDSACKARGFLNWIQVTEDRSFGAIREGLGTGPDLLPKRWASAFACMIGGRRGIGIRPLLGAGHVAFRDSCDYRRRGGKYGTDVPETRASTKARTSAGVAGNVLPARRT